jgi:hypothetical protein
VEGSITLSNSKWAAALMTRPYSEAQPPAGRQAEADLVEQAAAKINTG